VDGRGAIVGTELGVDPAQMLHGGEGSGGIAFREADHRAGITDLA
jgi:hypothetical protein